MAKIAQVRCIRPTRLGWGILTAFWLGILMPMAANTTLPLPAPPPIHMPAIPMRWW